MKPAFILLLRDAHGLLGWRLGLLAWLTFLGACMEGMTLAALLPILATMGVATDQATGTVTALATRLLAALDLEFTLMTAGGLLLVLIVISAVVSLSQAYMSISLQTRFVAHLQKRIVRSALAAGWPFLRRLEPGTIVNAAAVEAARIGGAFYQANLIVTLSAFIAVQIALAIWIAPLVTGMIVVFAALLFAATKPLTRRAVGHGEELTQANVSLQAATAEVFGAAKLVKATATEPLALARVTRAVDQIHRLTRANGLDVQIVRAIFEYTSGAAIALLLMLGPTRLGIETGAIIVVIAMFMRLFPKMTGLRQVLQTIGLALPAVTDLHRVQSAADAAREAASEGRAKLRRHEPAALALENVCVDGDDGTPILRNVDIRVVPGEFVAVVGKTGAGKTTLVDCLTGLAMPTSGRVLIDGEALTGRELNSWRRSVGYVGQEAFLFTGSVAENIRWVSGGAELSDDAIAEVLKRAAADFVAGLPDGADTPIGDRGNRLSGGERQRVALARALVGNPRLLILDEATSALDVNTEMDVLETIRKLRGTTTIIMITHRLPAAAAADRVVVLDRGEVRQEGRFSELAAMPGWLNETWNRAEQDKAGVTAKSAAPAEHSGS